MFIIQPKKYWNKYKKEQKNVIHNEEKSSLMDIYSEKTEIMELAGYYRYSQYVQGYKEKYDHMNREMENIGSYPVEFLEIGNEKVIEQY